MSDNKCVGFPACRVNDDFRDDPENRSRDGSGGDSQSVSHRESRRDLRGECDRDTHGDLGADSRLDSRCHSERDLEGQMRARPRGDAEGLLPSVSRIDSHAGFRRRSPGHSAESVIGLRHGADDVSRLAPGVYFVATSSTIPSPSEGERGGVRGRQAVGGKGLAIGVRRVITGR